MTYGSNNMADKASTPDTPDTSDPQLLLKKRARRRLVGATALALLAVIVLPMVMDQEAKPPTQDIQIRIPSQDPASNAFSSRIASNKSLASKSDVSASPSPQNTSEPPTTAPSPPPAPLPAQPPTLTATLGTQVAANTPHGADKQPVGKSEPSLSSPPSQEKAPSEKPKADETAHTTTTTMATTVPANNEHWVIQLGAYQEHGNVKVLQAKIKELGYRSYTEKIETANGSRTRVRAGPFTDRAAAEKAQERLKKIGAGGPTGGTLAPSKQP